MSGVRTVHLAPPANPIQYNESPKTPAKKTNGVPTTPAVQNSVQLAPKPNPLNALHGARVQSQIIFDRMKPLVDSDNRHGDLQVIRSAALNLIQHIDVLIHAEEE